MPSCRNVRHGGGNGNNVKLAHNSASVFLRKNSLSRLGEGQGEED
jgi:hypothetical protein